MSDPLGIAVIGLGPASLPHLKSLAELGEISAVRYGVCRTGESARRHGASAPFPVVTDLDAVLADPAVDAALVLTPAGTHLDVARRCLAAGKHVLVEKPLEVSIARAEELVALAEASGLRLGVVLQNRFRRGFSTLAAMLAAGELGDVQAASMRVPWFRPQSYYDADGRGTMARDGGGVLMSQAIHNLDIFRALVGISAVTAAQVATTAVHRMETEDYAAALVRLGNGAPGVIEATTAMVPGAPERIEIIGSKGAAVLSDGDLRVSFLDGRSVEQQGEGRTGSGANIMDFPIDAHRALLRDFVEAVRTGREPGVPGREALATQRVIERIVAAGRE